MHKNKLNIHIPTLKKVLNVQSKSNNDSNMLIFLKEYITTILNLEYEEDEYGNIYVTKGRSDIYPCIVAHVDTVHQLIDDKDFKIYQHDSKLFAFNTKKVTQTGIGGDDKVGVYLALRTLETSNIIKAVFYRNEEIGTLGSEFSIKNKQVFYTNIGYVIEGDRRDSHDLITTASTVKICSEDFINKIKHVTDKYKYKETTGSVTDVKTLVTNNVGVSCINLSVGYYNPHTAEEYVDILDINNAYNYIKAIINTLGNKKYPHIYVKPVYSYNNSSNSTKVINTTIYKPYLKYQEYGTVNSKYDKFVTFRYCEGANAEEQEFELIKSIYNGVITMNKEKHSCGTPIIYIPAERSFYCTKCGTYIKEYSEKEDELFSKLIITSNNEKFVYDTFNATWILKKYAVWNNHWKTYMTKKNSEESDAYTKTRQYSEYGY